MAVDARFAAALTGLAVGLGVTAALVLARARTDRRLARLGGGPQPFAGGAPGPAGPGGRRSRVREVPAGVPTTARGPAAGAGGRRAGILFGWLAAAAVAGAGAGLAGLMLVSGIGAALAWRAARRRRAWADAAAGELAAGLELLAAALRGGHSLQQALETVARAAAEAPGQVLAAGWRGVLAGIRSGRPAAQSVADWADAEPVEGLGPLAEALAVNARAGGELPALLEALVAVLGERGELRQALQARTQEARTTAWLLTAIPAGLLVYYGLAQPELLAILWEHAAGRAALAGSLAAWAVGAFVVRRWTAGDGGLGF